MPAADPDGTTSEPESVLEIDRTISSGGTSDCEFVLIDGFLRHIWYNRADQGFRGYLQKSDSSFIRRPRTYIIRRLCYICIHPRKRMKGVH